MYEEIFRSSVRPFRATPDKKFYFPHESIEASRQIVLRATLRAEGPVMVLGGAGLGKSLLGEIIASDLAEKFDIVKLQAARLCSRRALLQNILFELRMPYRNLSEGELRLSILDRLEPSDDNAPEGILIIVDEAHTLPAKLLDELRLLTNFTRNDQPRTRIVLIGSMRLEDTFASPMMESFNQRLAARCYLMPMNREQTHQYVQHQIRQAGYSPSEFLTAEGLDAVYAASEGVPRLANQIMDHALVLAVTNNQCPVSAPLIEEAWADLQQLPSPWHSAADRQAETVASVVEFGSIEDDVDEDLDASRFDIGILGEDLDVPSTSDSQSEFAAQPLTDEDEIPWPNDTISELEAPDSQFNLNFFAAFEALPECEFETVDSAVTDSEAAEILAATPSDEAPDESFLRPTIVFDAKKLFQAGRHAVGHDLAAANHILPTDSFFSTKQTDERMLALEDEQAQYDAMGVWENDPPISPTMSLVCAPNEEMHSDFESLEGADFCDEPVDELSISTAQATCPNDLFGDDFLEEVHITEIKTSTAPGSLTSKTPSSVPQETPMVSAAPPASQTQRRIPSDAEMQAELVADHLARIQQFSDNIEAQVANTQVPPVRVEEVLAGMQTRSEYATGSTQLDASTSPWTLDVAATAFDKESQVHLEIEDIVSQLNFSAFSVEPFSIEQINIQAVPGKPDIPVDSVRTGSDDEIYMMHRPQEMNDKDFFHEESLQYDDDRDLLIIEEDLPVSTKSADTADSKPVTRTAPYSQLFAKLRK